MLIITTWGFCRNSDMSTKWKCMDLIITLIENEKQFNIELLTIN